MNKRLQFVFMYLIFFFIIGDALILLSDIYLLDNPYGEISGFTGIILFFLLLYFLYSISKLFIFKDSISPEFTNIEVVNKLLFTFLVSDIYFIFFTRSFSFGKSIISWGSLLSNFFLANYIFLIILSIHLYFDFRDFNKITHQKVLGIINLSIVIIGYFSPFIVFIHVLILQFILPVDSLISSLFINNSNLFLFFVLLLTFFLFFYFWYLNTKIKIFDILIYRQSQDQKVQEFISLIYSDPIMLDSYLSPKIRLASLATIVTAIILLPMYLYVLII